MPFPRQQMVIGAGGCVLALGLMGFVVWHRASASSSTRAMREIGTAFRDHDGTRLAYYLDVDAVSQQVADGGVDWLVSQHARSTLAAVVADVPDAERGAPDSAARILMLKSALAERGGKGIGTAVMSGTADSANVADRLTAAFGSLPPLDVILAGDHLDISGFGSITTRGTERLLDIGVRDRELDFAFSLGIVQSHQGKRWQVIGVDRLNEVLTAIDNAQAERVSVANRPIEARLDSLVAVGSPTVSRTARGRWRTDVHLRVPFQNRSSQTIRSLDVALSTQASDDEHAETLHVDGPIAPGQAVAADWRFDETRSETSHTASMLRRPDELTIRTRRVILDAAGAADTVRLVANYRDLRRRNL